MSSGGAPNDSSAVSAMSRPAVLRPNARTISQLLSIELPTTPRRRPPAKRSSTVSMPLSGWAMMLPAALEYGINVKSLPARRWRLTQIQSVTMMSAASERSAIAVASLLVSGMISRSSPCRSSRPWCWTTSSSQFTVPNLSTATRTASVAADAVAKHACSAQINAANMAGRSEKGIGGIFRNVL